MKSYKYILAGFLVLCMWLSCLAGTAIVARPACADIVPYDRDRALRPASSTSDIGLAFLKMAGIDPDFEALARSSQAYLDKDPISQPEFLRNETAALRAKYALFDPGKDTILLRIPLDVKYKTMKDGTSTIDITFQNQGMVYFPVYYSDFQIAVLANGIENFQHIMLDKEETAIVTSHLDVVTKNTVLIELQPRMVDAKKAIKLDGTSQYPFLCDIVYFGILNKRAQQAWAWQSPTIEKNSTPLGYEYSPEK